MCICVAFYHLYARIDRRYSGFPRRFDTFTVNEFRRSINARGHPPDSLRRLPRACDRIRTTMRTIRSNSGRERERERAGVRKVTQRCLRLLSWLCGRLIFADIFSGCGDGGDGDGGGGSSGSRGPCAVGSNRFRNDIFTGDACPAFARGLASWIQKRGGEQGRERERERKRGVKREKAHTRDPIPR